MCGALVLSESRLVLEQLLTPGIWARKARDGEQSTSPGHWMNLMLNCRVNFKCMANVTAVTYTQTQRVFSTAHPGQQVEFHCASLLLPCVLPFSIPKLLMVTTRKENATKCVAQPVLAAKRKRCTKAEIEADKQRIEEERQNAEQVR